MDIITMWTRLMNLTPELATDPMPYNIASSMATCLMVEQPSRSKLTLSCPRALVEINANQRLWDRIPVNIGKTEPVIVRLFFEKLQKSFCKHCGILNHPKKKCVQKIQRELPQDVQMEEMEEKKEEENFVEDQLLAITVAASKDSLSTLTNGAKIFFKGESSKTKPINQTQKMVEDKEVEEGVKAKPSFKLGVLHKETLLEE